MYLYLQFSEKLGVVYMSHVSHTPNGIKDTKVDENIDEKPIRLKNDPITTIMIKMISNSGVSKVLHIIIKS